MTPEAKRIAIAEACGHKSAYSWMGDAELPAIKRGGIWTVGDKEFYYESLPDYLNDLNAMHEAEKTLYNEYSCSKFWQYADKLAGIMPDRLGRDSYIHATAAQRAEAFLRTIGQWVNSPETD